MLQNYFCYGFRLRSEAPLPELLPAPKGQGADIDIVFAPPSDAHVEAGETSLRHGPVSSRFVWPEIGVFKVTDGREIHVTPTPGAEPALIRLPLLGIVMSSLLTQRGLDVLHASAVRVGDGAVGFVGVKRAGKSTTAAAFHARGHDLLTDDVLALRGPDEGGGYTALPSFFQLKLWPDAAERFRGASSNVLHGYIDKRAVVPEGAFSPRPLPLRRLYVLDWGETTTIEPLSQTEAFVLLQPHTTARRFGDEDSAALSDLHRRSADLVRSVPVCRLTRSRSLDATAAIVEAVEEDLATGHAFGSAA